MLEGADPTSMITPSQSLIVTSESDNTQFAADGTVVTNSAIDTYFGDELLKNSSDGDDADLVQFLERPFSYVSGYLATTDTATTFSNYRPLADICQKEPYLSKLKGRFAIRANLKIRLEVNAQKFQSGRYILAWVPSGGAYGNGHTEYLQMHRHCLTQVTQLPHVELDLSTQTEAILEIPYVSFTTAMGIGQNGLMGDPGWVFLYPYVPLLAGSGSSTASYNLWFQMTNVELVSIALPQMGTTGQRESKAAKLGAYSTITSKIGKTAGQLGKIPLLSTFTSPAQFVAETLTGALQIWGLSKPPNFAPIKRVENVPFSHNACANVSDPTQPLSLDVNNAMGMIPSVGGSLDDEMSINYLKQIFTYFKRADWSVSATNRQLFTSFPVTPVDVYQTTTDSGALIRSRAPISFLADLFLQWRGGLKYKMKFVKTQFHSGRLLVAFSPSNNYDRTTPPTTSVDLSSYTHREIIDIRNLTEYEFTVPYTAITPWLNTRQRPDVMGYVDIFVLDSLVFPSTVPSVVPVIFEVAGAEDLSFAVPAAEDDWVVYRPATLQSKIPSLGGSSLQSDGLREAASCVGEVVLSLRSLIKRPQVLTYFGENKAAYFLYPYIFEVASGDGTVVNQPYIGGNNLMTHISSLYALSRGSMSFRMFFPQLSEPESPGITGNSNNLVGVTLEEPWFSWNGTSYDEATTASVQFAWTDHATTPNESISQSRARPFLTVVDKLAGGSQFTVPQYFTSHSRPMASALVTPQYSSLDKLLGTFPSWRVKITKSAIVTSVTILQYGADDYSLHRFVSVPPVIARGYTSA